MSHLGSIYQDWAGSFVRKHLDISERVVTQYQRKSKASGARQRALSQRLSKLDMHSAKATRKNLEEWSSLRGVDTDIERVVKLDRLRVVFVSTEVAPWSKVGGLADVLGALPKALASLNEHWNISDLNHGDTSMKQSVDIDRCSIWSVSPMYEEYEDVVDCGIDVPLPDYHIGAKDSTSKESESHGDNNARLYECMDGAVRRIFVKHPMLDMRQVKTSVTNPHPSLTYLDAEGGVYDCHNMEIRYDILAWGALAAGALLSEHDMPNDADETHTNVVFVLNDWPTALHVLRLKHIMSSQKSSKLYQNLSALEKSIAKSIGIVRTVFCIHNLAYQGVFSSVSVGETLKLPPASLLPLSTDIPWKDIVEFFHDTDHESLPDLTGIHLDQDGRADNTVNFMRAALLLCDQIVTVSPHYAQEIMSENGNLNCGMGDILRYRNVVGIMNGIDVQEWDPSRDTHMPADARYGLMSAPRGKAAMKQYIQKRFDLDVDETTVLVAFIGRLTEQKGVDVLLRSIMRVMPQKPAPKPASALNDGAMQSDVFKEKQCPSIQVIVLGTGDQWMEKAVESLALTFPGRAKGICSFSEELAHCMLAAADFAIIPSRFEPCGLIAQCAARYGAVPIMTATGGLKNLGDHGVGILVQQSNDVSKNVDSLVDGIKQATKIYESDAYRSKQIACMEYDFSWDKSARDWQYIIAKVLARP